MKTFDEFVIANHPDPDCVYETWVEIEKMAEAYASERVKEAHDCPSMPECYKASQELDMLKAEIAEEKAFRMYERNSFTKAAKEQLDEIIELRKEIAELNTALKYKDDIIHDMDKEIEELKELIYECEPYIRAVMEDRLEYGPLQRMLEKIESLNTKAK